MSEVWTTLKVLEWTTGRFERAGLDSPRLDAQVLLAHALSCDRVALYTNFDKPLGVDELAAIRALLKRRLDGEPVAYLVGEKEFWSLSLAVDARVLIPRPDTETLVEVALEHLRALGPACVLELGTGSGAVAVALAHELPDLSITATDVSAEALAVAAANIERHGLTGRVSLERGDLFAPVAGRRFAAVIANLPYIPTGELGDLPTVVRREPSGALDGGSDGLAVIRRLLDAVGDYVETGGLVALEHGWNQGEAVRELADRIGGQRVTTTADTGGRPRVTSFVTG